jgi:type IV pilus assembly protein PilW
MRTRQRGLSITELMVSVAISVAVLSALTYVYVGSRGAYRTNEALARVQETGRFALEWIARDLRSAGYMGCLSRGAEITFYSNPKPALLPAGNTLFGYENGQGFVRTPPNPRPNPTTIDHVRGDVVVMHSIDVSRTARVVEDTDVVNANIKINQNPGFVQGEFLVVTDCERAAVFTLTPGGNATTLAHAANVNGGLDTSDHRINPPFRAASRAFVARFGSSPTGYFIGNNRAGRPSLYRFSSSGAGARAEEVAENIEDLELLYGVDANDDGTVDSYLTADGVTAAGQWNRVLSVRISLVAVSAETAATAGDQVVYLRDTDGDTVVDPQAPGADRRLRQVFTTTVALRNRLP